MANAIFVNFPVADLHRAMAFYSALGFSNNPHFTDDTAACMVWNEAINVMLLTHAKWASFTKRPLPQFGSSEVMVALSLNSKDAVDAMNAAAAAHGGIADINPAQDHGFMYGRDFSDPDGHVWGPFWMDTEVLLPSE